MSITIKEIAELCGTSRGTVDRVLNGRGNVSIELESKIREVLTQHNYEPNTTARALVKSQKKCLIGVVINSVGNHFYSEVLRGVEAAGKHVENYGVRIIISELKGYSEDEQMNAICELEKQGIDGLALTPIYSDRVIDKIAELKEKGIPTVLMNADIDGSERLAVVASNNYRSGRLAANIACLVLSAGSHVAIVTGSLQNLGHIKRINGFRDAIEESGKQFELTSIVENDDDDDKSYQAVKQMIEEASKSEGHRIDLIYFGAAGVVGGIRAISDSGQTIKAITMDEGEEVKEYIQDGLVVATITQQPYEQGYQPIMLLTNYLVLNIKPEKAKIHTMNEIKIKDSFLE